MQRAQVFASPAHSEVVAWLVDGVLGSDESLLLSGDAGAGKSTVLALAIAELALHPLRLLRVCGGPQGLGLPAFVAQLAGRPVAAEPDEDSLERVFELLTVPSAAEERIVLIVDGAETLLAETLRYIQFACRAGPPIQLVLVGRSELHDRLKGDEFAYLRGRLGRARVLPALPAAAAPVSMQPRPVVQHLAVEQHLAAAARRQTGRRRHNRVLAGLGAAAMVLLGIVALGLARPPPAPVAASANPASPALAAAEARPPSDPAPSRPEAAAAEPQAPAVPGAVPTPIPPQIPLAAQTAMAPPDAPLIPRRRAPHALHARAIPYGAGLRPYRGDLAEREADAGAADREYDPAPLAPPASTDAAPPRRTNSFIGIYTTDANGMRVFRSAP